MLSILFASLKKLVKAGLARGSRAGKRPLEALGFFPDYGRTVISLTDQGKRAELRLFLKKEIDGLQAHSRFSMLGITHRTEIQLFRTIKDFDLFFSPFDQALVSRRNYLNALNSLSRQRGVLRASRLELAQSTDRPSRASFRQLGFPSKPDGPHLIKPAKMPRPTIRARGGFRASIENKTVLVLGPAASADSLDGIKADVLASPQLAIQGWGDEVREVDFSTRISYINGETLRRLELQEVSFTQTVDWVRLKDKSAMTRFKELMGKGVVPFSPVGLAAMPDKLLVNDYGPLMGPTMIFDLLRHRPGVVFVAGFDFYTSLKSYEPSYPTARSDIAETLWSLRVHEPFSNFVFLQRLWELGLIQPLGLTRKVLNLSVEQYAEQLKLLDSRSAENL